ncbi:MAG TPA: hypothetical protein PK177_01525 [Burkholderiaceae bacterium]|nr:hypothetical protein [Burkholderiaceae bacterium]
MARKLFCLVLGALAAVLLLELLLRVLPTPTASRIGQYVDSHVTTYPPGLDFRTATGWSLLNANDQRSNEFGFIPDRNFEPLPTAVAIVGDSLVEQSMLPPSHRLSAVLEQMRGEPVYAMGFPGSSLMDYLERMRYAHDVLGIQRFWVVVERADVKQSLCAANAYKDACVNADGTIARPTRAPRGRLYELLSRSALLQYFVGVLRLSPSKLLATFSEDPRPTATEAPPADLPPDGASKDGRAQRLSALPAVELHVIELFVDALDRFRQAGSEVGLLIDPRITSIHRREEFIDPAMEAVARRASSAGFVVVHPFEALAADVRASGLDLRVGPYDGHWNVRANCLIAASMLQGESGKRLEEVSQSMPSVCDPRMFSAAAAGILGGTGDH